MTDPLSPPDDEGADDWSFEGDVCSTPYCWCGCDWEDDDETEAVKDAGA